MKVLKGARYAVAVPLLGWAIGFAQTRKPESVNDSAAQASPIAPTSSAAATDSSAEASPISEGHSATGRALPSHTALHIVLTEGIDSGNLKNGQLVHGKLQSAGVASKVNSQHSATTGILKPGLPVVLTVIGTVPAGKLNAVGEMSLELVRVGNQSVDTNVLTFRGKPGRRDLPDSAPMIGTNAGLPIGTALTFVVQPPPSFADVKPRTGGDIPGSVTGHMAGSTPQNFGQPTVSSAPGSGVGASGAPIRSGDSPLPAQNSNDGNFSPKQMPPPSNTSPTAQPR